MKAKTQYNDFEGTIAAKVISDGRDTDSFFKKYTALCFYKLMNILGVKIPKNHSDYRLVSKRALDILAKYAD